MKKNGYGQYLLQLLRERPEIKVRPRDENHAHRHPEVLVLEPKVFGDERGFFFESFNQKVFREAVGRAVHFVQDNHSRSARGVLRGLHYQLPQPQGKLVRVVRGAVFDVAVDLAAPRRPSAAGWAWS
jgi:dTDP-4-dehydrorhamnose 3,5-epimerase